MGESSSSASSRTKPQQRTGSIQPMAEALRSGPNNNGAMTSSNSQRLLQLLQSTEPGQFVPLANQKLGEGHVTMIGYTTPIVRVGDPIPLEQYLREQRQIHDHQEQQSMQTRPLSSSSQGEFLARLNQQLQSNHGNNPVTESSLANSAQESTENPLQLLFTPNP
ncbi:hypothetical protein BLA29_012438, partial [Euroglyphus maynei]